MDAGYWALLASCVWGVYQVDQVCIVDRTCLLTLNNTDGDKRVIFSGIASYFGDNLIKWLKVWYNLTTPN